MKIINLFIAALVFSTFLHAAAVAQPEALTEDEFVTVSFGAVMMQVPAKLALQLCPDIELVDLAGAAAKKAGIACAIPHEEYTSHDPGE